MDSPEPLPRLTRRTVLKSAALSGAVVLTRPAAAAAKSSVFSLPVGNLSGTSPQMAAPAPFVLAGVGWRGPEGARIELRTQNPGRGWSPWFLASVLGHGPDLPRLGTPTIGEPIWTGLARQIQLRSSEPVRDVRLHFVATATAPPASAAATFPPAQPVLPAGPGQPPIIARKAWAHGAKSATPGYGTVKLAFVHHTDNANGYSAAEVPAMLLAIYQFHRFVRGWGDIGYNFVIDRFGRIWEARRGGIDAAVIGAQAGGYNAVSTGVAVLGTYMDVVPSQAAIGALEHLLAWKLSLHGVPTHGHIRVEVNPADAFYTPFPPGAHVSLPRVAGHRDGDSTDCPGNAFYARLPAIRPRIDQLAKSPARLTIKAAGPGVVSGTLSLLHGPPLGGVPVEVQQLRRSTPITVTTATTAADGTYSAQAPAGAGTRLRALHRPFPAAVSDFVQAR